MNQKTSYNCAKLKTKHMKKVMMLASAAMMVLSLNSCSSDDNGGGVSDAKLVGKWEHNTEKISAVGQTQGEVPYEGNEDGCSKDYIQFADGGVFTMGDYWGGPDCELDTTTATWSRDGKSVTISGQDVETETFTVTSVSATKLKVKYVTTIQGVDLVEEYTFTKAN